MNKAEFRAVLDWWMCSDPFPEGINKQVIHDWLDREAKERGYADMVGAYHEALAPEQDRVLHTPSAKGVPVARPTRTDSPVKRSGGPGTRALG